MRRPIRNVLVVIAHSFSINAQPEPPELIAGFPPRHAARDPTVPQIMTAVRNPFSPALTVILRHAVRQPFVATAGSTRVVLGDERGNQVMLGLHASGEHRRAPVARELRGSPRHRRKVQSSGRRSRSWDFVMRISLAERSMALRRKLRTSAPRMPVSISSTVAWYATSHSGRDFAVSIRRTSSSPGLAPAPTLPAAPAVACTLRRCAILVEVLEQCANHFEFAGSRFAD